MTELKIENSELDDLPPSVKLVYLVLQESETLTQSELGDRTLLPDRTVRYALTRLEDRDLVEKRPDLRDARRQEYTCKN